MINNYMLFKDLPKLDLHGYDRISALLKAKEFILDNYKLNNKLVVIVHGKGTFILKDTIHKMLKTNKFVKDYKIDIFTGGSTIIELKQKED